MLMCLEKQFGHMLSNIEELWIDRNDKDKIRASCKSEECKWMVYTSWLNSDQKTFKVKTLHDEHTCAMAFRNKTLSISVIAKKHLNQWKANPEWSFANFQQQLRDDTSCDRTLWQFYRAKKLAMEMVEGTMVEQYGRLWDYYAELRCMNPGSTINVNCTMNRVNPNPKFKRIYICL